MANISHAYKIRLWKILLFKIIILDGQGKSTHLLLNNSAGISLSDKLQQRTNPQEIKHKLY